jgi:hypothetical protein
MVNYIGAGWRIHFYWAAPPRRRAAAPETKKTLRELF